MKTILAALVLGSIAIAPVSAIADERKRPILEIDLDRDGRISGDEMRGFYKDDYDEERFVRADTDQDGSLDENEYAACADDCIRRPVLD